MNNKYEKKIGKNIKKLREEKCMTQEQLSAKLQLLGCDITRSALAKIEVGQRHLYIDEVKLIKEILDISFDDLIIQRCKKEGIQLLLYTLELILIYR